jgi:hypothetical protein
MRWAFRRPEAADAPTARSGLYKRARSRNASGNASGGIVKNRRPNARKAGIEPLIKKASAAAVKRVSARRSCSAGTKGGEPEIADWRGAAGRGNGLRQGADRKSARILTATRPSCDARLCRS